MFDSKVMGAEWRPATGEPNVFELVVRRQSPRDPANQAVFYTFPELSEWSTKDLYSPHPTLPDHWLYRGRADTVIVFSNGEKLNPVTLEDIIVGHPAVKAALVVGQDKFQPALVLEPFSPCEDDAAAEALINEVWPTVEKANAHTVAHGRLVRWLVMVTQPDKPLPRAPKGTVQRAAAAKLYKAEIEELYARAQAGNQHEAVALQLESEEALAQSIVDLFAGKLKVRDLAMDTDFFSAGVDSLQVMSATSLLRHGLEAAGIHVGQEVLAQRVIYQNPTPRQLALHLFPAIRQDKGVPTGSDGERQVKLMKDLLSRYTQNLPPPRPNKPQALDEGQTVLLTGTTGSLGAYMLDRLCSTDSVKKVIALNRGQDGGRSRQPAINSFRNLTTDFSKVEFLGVDLSEPDLGLGQAKYDELLASADRIIHNAWPVNFNISVASFEPHIRGVRHLVDFAAGAAKAVVLVFVSSIGELDGWPSARGPVPEQRLEELTAAQMGYGRSKLVGSLLVDTAARQSGIPAASVRVGQIAGPKQKAGVWNPQEFLPSLIASSVHLGILPSTLGPFQVVDWIPVEDVAELILDVTGVTVPVQPSEVSGYFHAVNPATTQWSELAVAVKDYYGDRIKKLVSLEEFVARLEESGTKGTDVNKNPGVKLLDTYRNFLAAEQAGHGHVFFETTKTKARSPTARHLSKVTPELMKNWCQQWGF
jgi:thioester reductase-like protein